RPANRAGWLRSLSHHPGDSWDRRLARRRTCSRSSRAASTLRIGSRRVFCGLRSYPVERSAPEDRQWAGANNQFDAEGRPVSQWGGAAVYDIDIPLPGGGAAVYNAGGLAYYRHADWLGSGIVSSTPSRTLLSTTHLTPFGFDETGAGANYRSFTGERQDTDSIHTGGQDDFLYREYNSEQGRWWTPDPVGISAADLTNPQSLNRYGYAGGAPLENVDPEGLDFEIIPCNPDDWNENPHCDPWGWMWGGEELLVPLGGGDGGGGFVGGAGGGPPAASANAPAGAAPPGAASSGGGANSAFDQSDFSNAGDQISSLWWNVKYHLWLLGEYPSANAVRGWQKEVRGWINQILKKAGKRQGDVDEYLQRIIGISGSDLKNLLPSPIIVVNPCAVNPLGPYCQGANGTIRG